MGGKGSKNPSDLYTASLDAVFHYEHYPIDYLYRDASAQYWARAESAGLERRRKALKKFKGICYSASLQRRGVRPEASVFGDERRLIHPGRILKDSTRLYFRKYYRTDEPAFNWVIMLVACEAGSKADRRCRKGGLPLLDFLNPEQCPFIFCHLSSYFVTSATRCCIRILWTEKVPMTWYEKGEVIRYLSCMSEVRAAIAAEDSEASEEDRSRRNAKRKMKRRKKNKKGAKESEEDEEDEDNEDESSGLSDRAEGAKESEEEDEEDEDNEDESSDEDGGEEEIDDTDEDDGEEETDDDDEDGEEEGGKDEEDQETEEVGDENVDGEDDSRHEDDPEDEQDGEEEGGEEDGYEDDEDEQDQENDDMGDDVE